jgi:hypothetical protein
MQDARARWGAAVVALLVVVSGCAAAGESPGTVATKHVNTADRRVGSVRPEPAVVASPPEASVPLSPPTTVTTRTESTAPATAPQPPPVVLPSVTIVALGGGSFIQSDDHECSNISAQTLTRGRLEVRRSGPTSSELTVSYDDSGITGDYQPLPGQITIPAGASSVVLDVDPTMPVPRGSVHVHRSSSLAVMINDGAGYDVGGESSAAIGLRFDVDVYGCPERAA